MPTDDVSDLRDVVDAINKLCDTMKTSYDGDDDGVVLREVEEGLVEPDAIVVRKVEIYVAERWCEPTIEEDESDGFYSEPVVDPVVYDSEPQAKAPVIHDSEPAAMAPVNYDSEPTTVVPMTNDSVPRAIVPVTCSSEPAATVPVAYDSISTFEPSGFEEPALCEPTSEMYYTASSEVSLVSDTDYQDRAQSEDSDRERDDRNSVMAGHVAAMRERFESMTRTNTPCPDLIRSISPSFEVFRNVSTSPEIEKT